MTGLVFQSLRHYARAHLRVFAGVLLAAAVLTGALLVGDSIDYSLRTAAMARLGDIHYAIDTRNQLIDARLAEVLQSAAGADVSAALRLRGMAIREDDSAGGRPQVNQVEVLGVDSAFWSFGENTIELAPFEAALSVKLAEALMVQEGDEISLRVAKPSLMARDSPLSWRDEDRTLRTRFTVKRVVGDSEMGRFGLSPTQTPPYNAFVNLEFLQERLELGPLANVILAGDGASRDDLEHALTTSWRPEHIGLEFRVHPSGVVQLESDRIFLSDETVRAAYTLPDAQGTLTYLVNSLSKGSELTPYFFVVAGPVPSGMADDEIVINRWVANEIGANVGDRLTLAYAELSPSNDFIERTRGFTVHSIREMEDLGTERELTPLFPGLSDVESCADWDVGMPMDEKLLNDEANEAYWEQYRQTPKAFVTLAAGQEMWGNRFGNLTAVRYPGTTGDVPDFRAALQAEMNPREAGLTFVPVREQALAAVSQAMDFGGLFLGMSFFLIVAALMLTGLLFAFGVEQRASQLGTLLALGFREKTVQRLLIAEGVLVAIAGAVVGAFAGTLYTRTLIYALTHFWGGAVAHASILYHARPATIFLGAAITLFCATLTMWLMTRRLLRRTPRELFAGIVARTGQTSDRHTHGRPGLKVPVAAAVAAALVVVYAAAANPSNVAPMFFASGALLLIAGLGLFRYLILAYGTGTPDSGFSTARLAFMNLSRRPGRSLAVVGLVASGVFLVLAVSSMQEDLSEHADSRASGTGGFALVAESTFPLLESPARAVDSPGVAVVPIKVRDGDDASCLNLNQAQTPRLLGVPVEEFASRQAFGDPDVWRILNEELPNDAVPALVGDANTAMWTLKKKTGVQGGDILVYLDQDGREVPIHLVGQLPMRLSVFQGSILISQEHFTRLFPSEDGYRMFLLDAPQSDVERVAGTLIRRFDRFGMDVVSTVQRLYEFYAVEATYLAMFLVLGGLGVAIGTIGLGVVILRNLHERRSELAMLKALGFEKRHIYRMSFAEYGFLVGSGLAIGGASAAIAMLPAYLAAAPTIATGSQVLVALLVVLASVISMWVAVTAGVFRLDYAALREE